MGARNFSSNVQLDISRVSALNDKDIELDNSCLGIEKDSFNSEKYCLFGWHQINLFAKLIKFIWECQSYFDDTKL